MPGWKLLNWCFQRSFLTTHLRGKWANMGHNTSEKSFLKQIQLISSYTLHRATFSKRLRNPAADLRHILGLVYPRLSPFISCICQISLRLFGDHRSCSHLGGCGAPAGSNLCFILSSSTRSQVLVSTTRHALSSDLYADSNN